MLQVGFGMTPFQSGSLTFASAVGAIAMKFVAPRSAALRLPQRAADQHGARRRLHRAAGVFAPATPVALMVALLLVGGFFRSLQFTSVNALTFADSTSAQMSQATTLTSVAQQIALSLGIAVGAIALQLSTRRAWRRRSRCARVLAGLRRRSAR